MWIDLCRHGRRHKASQLSTQNQNGLWEELYVHFQEASVFYGIISTILSVRGFINSQSLRLTSFIPAECQVSQNFSIACLILRIHLSIKPVPSDRRSSLREQDIGKVAACQNHDLLTPGHTWCTCTLAQGSDYCMDRCVEEEPQELRDISLCAAIKMWNLASSINTEVYFTVTALYINQKKKKI